MDGIATPPLCIIQARYNSTRLPGKMLLKLGRETLIERGHRLACEAFGKENVVVAIPASDSDGPLGYEVSRIGAVVYARAGNEWDVVGRLRACAETFRWDPLAVIVRWTPDDYRKQPALCRRVVTGERLPVAMSCEAFTLATLRELDQCLQPPRSSMREHMTLALSEFPPPFPADDGYPWSIDNQSDYERACEWVESFR